VESKCEQGYSGEGNNMSDFYNNYKWIVTW
jgi:hypothetical protein